MLPIAFFFSLSQEAFGDYPNHRRHLSPMVQDTLFPFALLTLLAGKRRLRISPIE